MSKIIVECADPNDLNAVEAATESFIGKCNITYFKQHQEMVEAGTSKSKSGSARIIAEGTEETPEAVRHRIRSGEKELADSASSEQPSVTPQFDSETPNNQTLSEKPKKPPSTPTKDGPTKGGRREGSGRSIKRKSQKAVWRNVEKKLLKLTEYIRANCEFPGNISEKTKKAIFRHIDDLNMFYNDL